MKSLTKLRKGELVAAKEGTRPPEIALGLEEVLNLRKYPAHGPPCADLAWAFLN